MFPGQVDPAQAMLEALLNAKEPGGGRYPFLGAGRHVLAISSFKMKPTLKNGPAIGVEFMVLESNNPAHAPGSFAAHNFLINRKPYFPGDDRPWGEARQFGGAVLGETDPMKIGQSIIHLLQGSETEPLRGARVIAHGTVLPAKLKKDNTMGKPFTEVRWEQCPGQTQQTVYEWRQRVEAELAKQPAPPPPPAQQSYGFAPAQAAPAGYPFGAQPQQAAPAQQPAGPAGSPFKFPPY